MLERWTRYEADDLSSRHRLCPRVRFPWICNRHQNLGLVWMRKELGGMEQLSTRRSRTAGTLAAACLVGGIALSPWTSSPGMSVLVVALIALIWPAEVLSRRLGSSWPIAFLAAALFATLAMKEWMTPYRTQSTFWALGLFLLAAVAAAIGIAGVRGSTRAP